MSQLTVSIPASMVVPILQTFKSYFDEKYPCTDESNDGSDMSNEDQVKYQAYNCLLSLCNKNEGLYRDQYLEVLNKLSPLTPPTNE